MDRTLNRCRQQLANAVAEEDFQVVGLHCREILISLADVVWDAARHPTLDEVPPSEADAKRKLEAYIAVELSSGANEEVRRHARASLSLALALQHRRTAGYRDAAMCLEGTTSMVNLLAIVQGRRDPDRVDAPSINRLPEATPAPMIAANMVNAAREFSTNRISLVQAGGQLPLNCVTLKAALGNALFSHGVLGLLGEG